MIVLNTDPLNLEMPFSKLSGFITPDDEFYVRCHFPIPDIALDDWRLEVGGAVEAPFELTYQAIREMESRTVTATLECAGNGRTFLEPKANGVPWGPGAVGNASWTGVPLSAILERAGVSADAIEVIFEGSDAGKVPNGNAAAENTSFSRSVPLGKALFDTILAYEMNGRSLSSAHGFPLRAIVPGWYAMASVKWLRRITVTAQPFTGYYQTLDYTFHDSSGGEPLLSPLTEQQVKSQIANPETGQVIPAGSVCRVHGAAWSGEAEIDLVELSFDAGATWHRTTLLGDSVKNAWRLWEYDWRTSPHPERLMLLTRATDSRGRVQPVDRDPYRGTYMINHLVPVTVEVR
jgi:DMSO/TMAO reductase YedYZ molybdopterin-dependent catalytic subunit